MTVRRRLLLLGGVLPIVALVAVAYLAGTLLERQLRAEIDQHLLAQAAVESVGLFDGPGGHPHLHAHVSPLAADLDQMIPDGAIYDADGAPVVTTHAGARVPPDLRWPGAQGQVELRHGRHGPLETRELRAVVTSPAGDRYVLFLTMPTTRVDTTMRTFWLGAGGAVAGIGGLLLVVQAVLAGRMARRAEALGAYVSRLRDGQADPPPPVDPSGDELAALRDGLYAAARQLEAQRADEQRWLASAAHDLRTPLGVLRTTVDLALRRPRPEPELRTALAEVGAEVDRLTGLVEVTLGDRRAARVEAEVALDQVVRAACVGVNAQAGAAGLTLLLATEPIMVRGDLVSLRRIIDNLLHNAISHGPAGSTVEVELAEVGGRARLRVRDHGRGIPASEREQVFLPFWRGPDSRGSGLGLAIVRQLASEHGGAAVAAEVDGAGAALEVELPLARQLAP